MIPKECKRLAEVDFPIAVVSRHSAREKSIRHGHPSTLHLWWARRPLAACRAMLLALLLPDPCDPNCPDDFKVEARALLSKLIRDVGKEDSELRKALLKFIGDFANWDYAAKPTYLEVGRGLVKAAHGEETPLVVDPFAGGGSIPLEALRLGCDAFASDLNPVACLILKVMLEDIPRYGPGLADELRKAGAEIKKQAEKELSQYYPPDPDGATPIAYLWARTVRCESPNCGAEIPLVRSFWLCKKANRARALRYKVRRPRGMTPHIEFEVFEPTSASDIPAPTVKQGNATCPACQRVLAVDRVRVQLGAQHGGADAIFDGNARVGGAQLIAVVTLKNGDPGRHYRAASTADYEPVRDAQRHLAELVESNSDGRRHPCAVPDEEISTNELRRISVPLYGMKTWGDLFTARQKIALWNIGSAIEHCEAPELREPLGLAFDGTIDRNAALATWRPQADQEKVEHVFARQALGMCWDFAEAVPVSTSTGSFEDRVEVICRTIAALATWARPDAIASGQVEAADAANSPLPDDGSDVWFTDPPYYDAVPYAHLSDFFYVWLRRSLGYGSSKLFGSDVSPKSSEIVVDRPHSLSSSTKGVEHYERAMAKSFAEGRRVLRDTGVGSVVFAHKTTEGWEALLSGLIQGGWTITGSWPVATEMSARLNARETASLATSVHLVCRPRPEAAEVGDWAEVFRELPNRIGNWMERLSAEGVHGADLVFACIGPAMEIYSRYRRVEDAEGRPIPLGGDPEATEPYQRGFLAYVWEIVGRTALGQVLGTAEARARNGAAGALEEDARLTALFLWTIQSTASNGSDADENDAETDDVDDEDEAGGGTTKKGLTLIFDVVRRFSQPLGIHLDNWEGRIIETKKGIVRLLPIRERAESLLGEDGASGAAEIIERSRGGPLNYEFGFMGKAKPESAPRRRAGRSPLQKGEGRGVRSDEAPALAPGTTTLDRVHIAMLLQASGKANALRTMLKAEAERGPDFLRLANALSALYPRDSEEKRLLDAMLLAMPK
jgi:adenine-specific DNA methylase